MVLLLKALARLNLRGQVWDSGCQKKKKKKAAYLAQTLLLQVAFLCQHGCLWSCVIMTRELI